MVLQAISAVIRNVNGDTIEIVPLSPQADQTSGRFPRHGWTAVRDWCISHRPKSNADVAHMNPLLQPRALRKNWRFLVRASNAEGLIVQIDTDIVDLIVDLPQNFATTGISRKEYTEAAVLKWLAIPEYPTNSLFLVLSSHSTEAWILACYGPADPIFSDLPAGFSYEDLHDVEQRLIRKGLLSRLKKGKHRLEKTPTLYRNYGAQIAVSLNDVRGRCEEANSFCSFLETA